MLECAGALVMGGAALLFARRSKLSVEELGLAPENLAPQLGLGVGLGVLWLALSTASSPGRASGRLPTAKQVKESAWFDVKFVPRLTLPVVGTSEFDALKFTAHEIAAWDDVVARAFKPPRHRLLG